MANPARIFNSRFSEDRREANDTLLGSFYGLATTSVSARPAGAAKQSIDSIQDSAYQSTAANSLSDLFYTYSVASSSVVPSGVTMPHADYGVTSLTKTTDQVVTSPNFLDLVPFNFNPDYPQSSGLVYRHNPPTGYGRLDSMEWLLSGSGYQGDPTQLRDPRWLRGMGLRAPVMVVGWGYGTDGTPYPTGSGVGKFKGEYDYGYQVNPKEYIVAPLDLRYDPDRMVWVTTGEATHRHQHLKNTVLDGGPAFATFFADDLAEASGLGYANIVPELIAM